MNEVAEVIKGARDILATGAWCKGRSKRMTPEGVTYCAIGALDQASQNLRQFDCREAWQLVERLAPTVDAGLQKAPLAAYNDDPDTTLQDVLNLFDKALAELGALA